MKWREGMIVWSGEGKGCNGLIQQLEGQPGLHIEVYKNGRRHTNNTITDWNEAKKWADFVELGIAE